MHAYAPRRMSLRRLGDVTDDSPPSPLILVPVTSGDATVAHQPGISASALNPAVGQGTVAEYFWRIDRPRSYVAAGLLALAGYGAVKLLQGW